MKEDIVARWVKKAENDLKVVEHLLVVKDAPADVLCFHCQQAVEKCLKAYLTWSDIRVRKTHDLESILNLCRERDKEFEKLDKEKISELTIYATEIRYPEEVFEPSMEEVKGFYETAKAVKEFVIKKLKKAGFSISK